MKTLGTLFSALCLSTAVFAQLPASLSGTVTLPAPAVWNIAAPASVQLPSAGADKIYDFGIALPLDTTLHLEGFTTLGPDVHIGQLVFESEGALSLNFFFSELSAPEGTRFWLFNEYGILGPYSPSEAALDGSFVTLPLGGQRCTLEVQSPRATAYFSARVQSAIYGVRAEFLPVKGFGSSGNCNVNINCPQGTNWQTEKRSAVMLLTSGGTRFCSGALVNNTAQDGRPYILTANHCNVSTSTVFMFNYESPDCSNIDGPQTQTVNGASVHARHAASDFALLEMNFPPPAGYFAYYSGWDRSGTATEDHVGIHHPKGDIKKISRDTSMIQDSCYDCSDPTENHWKVQKWDSGTTEGGSSGSPLYDAAHRIVGQLHGGQASCSNPNGSDYYGKFSVSWEGGGTPDTRLRDWLDPGNTGQMTIDGYQPATAPVAYGVDISSFSSVDSVTCADTTRLFILVSNIGFEQLDSVCVRLSNGNTSLEQCRGGSWDYSDQVMFTFPARPLKLFGGNTFGAVAWSPGTPAADTAEHKVVRVQGAEVRLVIHYDLYPQEFSWEIADASGQVVESGSGQNASAQAIDTLDLCLPYACYTLKLNDSGGDGLCCGFGNGRAELLDVNGVQIGQWSSFGASQELDFCNPYTPGLTDKDIFVFPNPASASINVALPGNLYEQAELLLICDMNGKVLVKKENDLKYLNTFDVSNWAQGVYIVYMRSGKNKARTRFVKI